jgi:mitogen-activated protein kinase 15
MFLQELNASHHENIIRLLNVLKADNDKDMYLVFEYMEINLHSVIRANILEDVHQRYILYQVVKSILYMHSGQLLHRDLKPSNVLLNADCRVKICDLGLARSVHDISTNSKEAVLTDYVATRWYRAPEILLGSGKYNKSVDVWAIGCILAEMLGGRPLFQGESTLDQLLKICEVLGRPSEADVASVRSKFAASMLDSVRPKRYRPVEQLFPNAPSDALDLLAKLLCFSPDRRPSCEEILRHPYLAAFHDPAQEPVLKHPIHISMDDNQRYSIADYRKSLYKRIVQRKHELRQRSHEVRTKRRLASANSDRRPTSASNGGSGSASRPPSASTNSSKRPTSASGSGKPIWR